jgi:dTDP-4-dehydrorhamnose reductase
LKILLTGAAGQLGNELYPLLHELGSVTAADLNPAASNAPDCLAVDLGEAGRLQDLLDRAAPDVVINAAAYTAVDRAEEQPGLAHLVNADIPGQIARWAKDHGAMVVHYSTDYVFDGSSRRPYVESDPPAPLNVYGESKLGGERAVQESGCRALILRTSWVYSSHGNNFVLGMLKLARDGRELRIVDDQVGCPTWAHNLALATRHCLERGLPGAEDGCLLYHYSDRDAVSWHGFAAMIFEHAVRLGLLPGMPRFSSTDTAGYPQPATRPAYSVLDTSAMQAASGFQPPGLNESLLRCMKEIAIDE